MNVVIPLSVRITEVNKAHQERQELERERRRSLGLEVMSYHEFGKSIWDCQTEFRDWYHEKFGLTAEIEGTQKLYYNGGRSWRATNHAGQPRMDTNIHTWLVETQDQKLLATLRWSRS